MKCVEGIKMITLFGHISFFFYHASWNGRVEGNEKTVPEVHFLVTVRNMTVYTSDIHGCEAQKVR